MLLKTRWIAILMIAAVSSLRGCGLSKAWAISDSIAQPPAKSESPTSDDMLYLPAPIKGDPP